MNIELLKEKLCLAIDSLIDTSFKDGDDKSLIVTGNLMNIQSYFMKNKSEIIKENHFFNYFESLSFLLEKLNFEKREVFSLVMYAVENNIQLEPIENFVVNPSVLVDIPYEHVSKEEISYLINSGNLNNFLIKSKSELTKEQYIKQQEIKERMRIFNEEECCDLESLQNIKKCYFDKNNKWVFEDLMVIFLSLHKIGIGYSAKVVIDMLIVLLEDLKTRCESIKNSLSLKKGYNAIDRLLNIVNYYLTKEEVEFNILKCDQLLKHLPVDLNEVNYLNETQDDYAKYEVRMIELIRIKNVFSLPQSQWGKKGEVFRDFKFLSEYLIEFNLSPKDKKEIILTLIERNSILKELTDEYTIIFDPQKILKHDFKSISHEDLLELIINDKLYDIFNKQHLSLKEQEIKDELLSCLPNLVADTDFIKISAEAKKLIDKKNKSMEDLEKIIEILKQLEVDDTICEEIKEELIKDINKTSKNEQEETTYLTDKEYKALKKEINTYYDMYKMEIKKDISEDELKHLAILMYRLGVNEYEIDGFISRVCDKFEFDATDKIKDIKDVLEYYEKLKYYYPDKLDDLDFYFSNLFIVDNHDYVDYKNELIEEANKLLSGCAYKYKYDYEKTLVKQRKN